jgi:hypothetical protein
VTALKFDGINLFFDHLFDLNICAIDVRVGPEVVTDPAFLVTRYDKDFVVDKKSSNDKKVYRDVA